MGMGWPRWWMKVSFLGKWFLHMGVSENGGFSPQIIHLKRDFHYKSSILGYPLFLETSISSQGGQEDEGKPIT